MRAIITARYLPRGRSDDALADGLYRGVLRIDADDLNVPLPEQPVGVVLPCLDVEADELQSFVGNKANQ